MVAACWTDGNLEHRLVSTTSATHAFPFPVGYSAGNLVLVFAAMAAHDVYPSTPAAPSGWTQIANLALAPGSPFFLYGRVTVFGRVLDGSEGGSVTLAGSAPGGTWRSWNTALLRLDAKLNGDTLGGFADDHAAVADSLSLPALTSSRKDNVGVFFGCARRASGLGEPGSGWCLLERDWDVTDDLTVALSVRRYDMVGSTGSWSSAGDQPRGAVGLLIPAHPYLTRWPVVGFIGWNHYERSFDPLVPVTSTRTLEDGTPRTLEDGVTERTATTLE